MSNVNITFTLKDALYNALSGTIRIEQFGTGSESGNPNIVLPHIIIMNTSGNTTISLSSGSIIDAWLISNIDYVGYYLGHLVANSTGSFGTLIRTANGQSTGSQVFRSISGTLLTRSGAPTNPVYVSSISTFIDKGGVIIGPGSVGIPVDGSGNFSIQLPESSTLYSPRGDNTNFRLTYNNLPIGSTFTIPSQNNMNFRVTNNAVSLST